MRRIELLKGAVAALTIVALLAPSSYLLADTGRAVAKQSARAVAMGDVVLSAESTFSGRVVDHNGTVVEGAEVVVKQAGKEVARVVTDEKGVFSLKEVKNGVYEVASGNTAGKFRVWNETAAPPAAKGQALLVMGENGARGQFGTVNPTDVLLTAAVIAGLVVGAVALSEINNVQKDVNRINRTLGN